MALELERLRRRLLGRAVRQTSVPARAAVAIIFRVGHNRDGDVLIIERSRHPSDPWSGHLAFPGGKQETNDESLLATAVREVKEEVGLELLKSATLLGGLDHVRARGSVANFSVAPYVFEMLDTSAPLSVDSKEVQRCLWVPTGPLQRGEQDTEYRVNQGPLRFRMPAYEVHGRQLWGLSYQILSQAFRCMAPEGSSGEDP